MPILTTIDDLIEQNSETIRSDESAMVILFRVMTSYFVNYGALNKAEKISEELHSLPDNVDERPVRNSIADKLKAEGLVGSHADPNSYQFDKYFSPKRTVLDQVIQLIKKKAPDGTDTFTMVIEKAIEYARRTSADISAAVFDMVDYFVADAPTKEAVAFLKEVGSVLYKKGHFGNKATYTTLGRAESFYREALEKDFVDERFNGVFVKFASGCTKGSPVRGDLAAAYSYMSEQRRLESLVDALKTGGYESFVAFRNKLEVNFGRLQKEYRGMSLEMRGLIDFDKGITPLIPQGIQKTLFGEMCLKVATQYIKG